MALGSQSRQPFGLFSVDERMASASDRLYGVILTLAVKYGDNVDIAEVSRLVAKEWRKNGDRR